MDEDLAMLRTVARAYLNAAAWASATRQGHAAHQFLVRAIALLRYVSTLRPRAPPLPS